MYWIKSNLGTASLPETEKVKKLKNVEVEIVYDLVDGLQDKSKGQFQSKVKRVCDKLKRGKRVIIICRGGLSRSNAVAVAVLMVYFKMDFDIAYDLVYKKVPIQRIAGELLDFIKKEYGYVKPFFWKGLKAEKKKRKSLRDEEPFDEMAITKKIKERMKVLK